MAFFKIFRKYLFLEKKSFISLCVNFDTLYSLYTFNMAKCQNLLFLLALAVKPPPKPPFFVFHDWITSKHFELESSNLALTTTH